MVSFLPQWKQDVPLPHYSVTHYNSCSLLQACSLAQSKEGSADSGTNGGEDWPSLTDRRIQSDDRILRFLRELPGLNWDSAVSTLQCLCARQPWCVWQLRRECVSVPQMQVGSRFLLQVWEWLGTTSFFFNLVVWLLSGLSTTMKKTLSCATPVVSANMPDLTSCCTQSHVVLWIPLRMRKTGKR